MPSSPAPERVLQRLDWHVVRRLDGLLQGEYRSLFRGPGVDLAGLTLEDMQAEEPGITADVFGVLTVDASVASRTSYGGTAPANVAAQAVRWQAALA